MQEPKKFLDIILNDPYATRQSHEAALKLFNMLRRQVTRRKRANERRDVLAERVAELESINADILAAVDQFLSDEGYSDEEVGGLLCPWINKVKEPPR